VRREGPTFIGGAFGRRFERLQVERELLDRRHVAALPATHHTCFATGEGERQAGHEGHGRAQKREADRTQQVARRGFCRPLFVLTHSDLRDIVE